MVFGDGYKFSIEENGTYGVAGVLWDFSLRSVKGFSSGGSIGMADGGGGGDRLCERKYLFLCWHSDNISDFCLVGCFVRGE